MPSGRLRTRPELPELSVPSQNASTSSLVIDGVEAKHCSVASTRRSSAERSQRSPKAVQPMPTMATLSRMPLLANGSHLPEVVVHAAGGVQPAERQLQPRADLDVAGRGV